MFDFQILHADSNNSRDYDFSKSTYKLKDGELFGYYSTGSGSGNGFARLYIGDGKTALGQLRYIGRDIDEGNITNSTIYNSFLRNVTIDDATINGYRLGGNFDCANATLSGGKLMGFAFDGCNIPTDNTLTNNGIITGGTLSGNAFISGNTNTDITGGKIAGSTILFSKSVNDGEFTNVGYIGNQGDPGQEKFFSSTGYPAHTNFGGTTLRCLDIKGYTMIDETGKFNTRSALVDGKLGYDDNAYHTVIKNTDLSIGNKFPEEIDTKVTSANYLSNSTIYKIIEPEEIVIFPEIGYGETKEIAQISVLTAGEIDSNTLYILNLHIFDRTYQIITAADGVKKTIGGSVDNNPVVYDIQLTDTGTLKIYMTYFGNDVGMFQGHASVGLYIYALKMSPTQQI